MTVVKIEKREQQVFLILDGVLGATDSPRLRSHLSEGLMFAKRIVVDFSKVSQIDCAIVANLVEATALARRSGIELALASVPKSVQTLFELLRLNHILAIEDLAV
jgi:anti-anti-sigma factor